MKLTILLFGILAIAAAYTDLDTDTCRRLGGVDCKKNDGSWWCIPKENACLLSNYCCEFCGCDTGCFSAGTKITLASGEEIAIDKQSPGLKLTSNAGETTTVTNEYIENDMMAGGQLFGINEGKPFATLNHPFWTEEGWKCINPESATEENPDISYGVLQVGDTVFRMAQTDPLLYEPVTIWQLTFTTLSEPSKTYGLNLNGPQSYHANGYVVAANYPILTEKRVHDGMKKLSNGEKESLKSAIGSGKEVEKVWGKWAKAFYDSVNIKSVGKN